MKVLIGVDASPSSQALLEEVQSRPWPEGTIFCVLNALDLPRFAGMPTLVTDAKNEGRKIVEAAAAKLKQAGLTCVFHTAFGSPRTALADYAKEWGADLILVGSHGHSAIGRFLLGSVAQGTLRHAHCPVEIVRAHGRLAPPSSHPMKILLATDGTEFSLAAARWITQRPWPKKSVFRILSVEELVTVGTGFEGAPLASVFPPTLLEELITEARERAKNAVKAAENILQSAGLNVLECGPAPTGDPRGVVLDTAESWGADMIVLGSHGRRGLDRVLLGSVAESVAVHAKCSVEVIRQN